MKNKIKELHFPDGPYAHITIYDNGKVRVQAAKESTHYTQIDIIEELIDEIIEKEDYRDIGSFVNPKNSLLFSLNKGTIQFKKINNFIGVYYKANDNPNSIVQFSRILIGQYLTSLFYVYDTTEFDARTGELKVYQIGPKSQKPKI